jgi:hypothetical protein
MRLIQLWIRLRSLERALWVLDYEHQEARESRDGR